MDSLQAYMRGRMSQGNPLMVFDWAKAARIIKEREPQTAGAGLREDWEWTGGEIWRNGAPVPEDDTYTYLSSTWAIPELEIDGEITECYIMEDETEWGPHTYWPEEALKILAAPTPESL